MDCADLSFRHPRTILWVPEHGTNKLKGIEQRNYSGNKTPEPIPREDLAIFVQDDTLMLFLPHEISSLTFCNYHINTGQRDQDKKKVKKLIIFRYLIILPFSHII